MFKNEVIDEYQSDYIELKELAKNQRQELDIGDEIPVANYLVELLRRKGIVLLRYPFRNNDAKPFSGMMLEMDNGNGVDYYIGINSNDYVDKQNFSIAHEIYHYAMRQKDRNSRVTALVPHLSREEEEDPEENKADLFAAEFLLPIAVFKKDIVEEFGQINIQSVDYISIMRFLATTHCKWKLPFKSIVRRLREAGAISSEQYFSLYEMNERERDSDYYRLGLVADEQIFIMLNSVTKLQGIELAYFQELLHNYEDGIVEEEELIHDLKIFGKEPEELGIHFELGEEDEG